MVDENEMCGRKIQGALRGVPQVILVEELHILQLKQKKWNKSMITVNWEEGIRQKLFWNRTQLS